MKYFGGAASIWMWRIALSIAIFGAMAVLLIYMGHKLSEFLLQLNEDR